jgi:ubiquinone/menaquinone biosynthesis C-methylase UbiE
MNQSTYPLVPFARQLWRFLPLSVRVRFWVWWGGVFPYQRMTYKGKVLTWGRDRTTAYRILFPTAPKGKTILDVGCHTGFYCFEAASQGAKYCLGIDIEQRRIAKGQALILKHGLSNIDLVAGDVGRHDFNRAFDIVLCLNLLQHMKTIDRVEELLTHLHRVAKERLILIVPFTTRPGLAYEYGIRDSIPYVLLSAEYFRAKYGESVQILDLPPDCYGPNRAAVSVEKSVTSRSPQDAALAKELTT